MIITDWPERILGVVLRYPAGAMMSSRDIAREAGVVRDTIVRRLDQMAAYGIVKCHSRQAMPTQWVRGPAEDAHAAVALMRADSSKRRADTRASAMGRAKEYSSRQTQHATISLRRLMADGSDVLCGDPLAPLADCMKAARAVMVAKSRPGARFNGAEVDLLVARELRAVNTAAHAAADTLKQALALMLG